MTYLKFIGDSLLYYLINDWHIILMGILIATSMKVFVNPESLKNKLLQHSKIAVPLSVGLGALTPLCACGTMAVVISLFLTKLPWGPVMAFLISSPLASPSEFLFEGSFMGWRFAISMLVASIVIGLFAGYLATVLEKRTSFFKDQFRILDKSKQANTSASTSASISANTSASTSSNTSANTSQTLDTSSFMVVEPQYETAKKIIDMKGKSREFVIELWETGFKKIIFYFMIFILIGKSIEFLIPMDYQMPFLSEDSFLSVLIGATVGLPLYINSASSLPLMQSMVASGVSESAIFAFLIAGKATGIPVIVGMMTFLKKRAIAFYVGVIWVGAVIAGSLSIMIWKLL
jgi:uncharacterized membrane protein YraQ (UPF0718 family)